jgi:hypothetical protein
MKKSTALLLAALALPLSSAAFADGAPEGCSAEQLVGRWIFATDVGHQQLQNAPPPGDITAIGTMNIRRNGELEGTFDVTFEGAAAVRGVLYSGTVSVNADCTGTLTFVTSRGTSRTDSIAVLNRYEIVGMSLDPKNLWTYRARRLAGRLGFARD